MKIGVPFHRSIYVTLGLACACLGYAELSFLPEMSAFAAVVGVLLIVAYYLEGRWALSIRAANILGGVIAVGAVAWVAYQFFRPWGGTLLDQLPWPTSLLPYLGPLLMILVPAKLFRPKHNGDFWALQGAGLIAVALGCALAGDILFGVLLLAYLVSVMWSLTLFYYYRESLRAGTCQYSLRESTAPPRVLKLAGRWAVMVGLLALVLFLGTPRSGEARWELTLNSARLQTGYDDKNPGIDLNRNGSLRANRDMVLEVTAFSDLDGTVRKTDLDPGQRWRGQVFNYYDHGRWEVRRRALDRESTFVGPPRPPASQITPVDVARTPPPPLQSGEYLLEIRPNPRNPNVIALAEPVTSIPGDGSNYPAVISRFDENQLLAWIRTGENDWRPQALGPAGAKNVYIQRVSPRRERLVSPPVTVDFGMREHLRTQEFPRLREWTRALIERLVDEERLPRDVLDDPDPTDKSRISSVHYEEVARALEAYLSLSGEYRYSLDLQRNDSKLDPVEDFLFNIRRGHCNRFTTALALMLRTQGVPTRVVLGFRGLETDGDGIYTVRQYQAHSWVEALIQRDDDDGQPSWHWRTLDPTPAGDDSEVGGSQWGTWWELARNEMASIFKNFVVEYDADQQDRAYTALGSLRWETIRDTAHDTLLGPDGDEGWRTVMAVAAIGGLVFAARRAFRRSRSPINAPDPDTAFYRQLMGLIARHLGAKPRQGQTAAEFAEVARDRLATTPETRDLGSLPVEATILYYRVRFGGRPLAHDEQRSLRSRVDRLEAVLAGMAPSN
jgi:hypothetical protein